MNLRRVRQTAAQILAATLFETYPSVELWGAEATDTGFSCDLYFPHPVNPETLVWLEERMRQIVREDRPIRTLEMVPASAYGLLKKEGHAGQCEILEEIEGNLVELIEIGTFHQLSEGPHLESTGELGAFKLLSLEPLPDQGIRISGVAAESKEELKEYLKKLSAYRALGDLGQNQGFWRTYEEGLVWTEKGIEIRERIQKLFFPETPQADFSGESWKIAERDRREFKRLVAESTKDLHGSPYAIQKTIFTSAGESLHKVTSSLHSNYKILIMLGFDCWVRIAGKRRDWKDLEIPEEMLEKVERVEEAEPIIEFMVEDPILRPWAIASVKKQKLSTGSGIAVVTEAFVERILVLLLEMNLGIPLFLENRGK
ncbi:MAG: hypothetical protein JSS32_10480 [Verrucomicrobia bacterium]|nr:hypothetical protein [Verrucomicrobiota bacterium]